MTDTLVGFLISFGIVIALFVLFGIEERRGVRFASSLRAQADFLVLKLDHKVGVVLQLFGRDFIRQLFHYLFHTILRFLLVRVRKLEAGLKNVMRVNKTIAQTVERENATRTKLEEVAKHKVASALSEEEKRKIKEKTLNGG